MRASTWCFVAMMMVGCSSKSSEPTKSEGSAVAPAGSAPAPIAKKDADNRDFTIGLLEPGDEPRRAVAYAMSRPERQAGVHIRIGKTGFGFELDGTIAWKRTQQTATGGEFEFRFPKVEGVRDKSMSDDEWKVVSAVYDGFKRAAGRGHITPSGVATLEQTEALPTTPSWPVLLSLSIVPLPSEPIGLHAKWRTKQTMPLTAGQRATVEREFEVVSLTGDTLVINTKGKVTDSANPTLSTMIDAVGKIDLADPLPIGTLSLGTEMPGVDPAETAMVFEIE